MADVVSPEKRSQMMAGIRNKNTKPELRVRKELHRRGFRYRLHRLDLPGKPDIYLPRFRIVVFVHGCFWHGHDCKFYRTPKTNSDFWVTKIGRNRERDNSARDLLRLRGIKSIIVWECATRLDQAQFRKAMDKVEDAIRAADI